MSLTRLRPAKQGTAGFAVAAAAATAALALAIGGAAARGAFAGPGRHLAALGTPVQCERYGGVPPGWPQDARAGMVHLARGSFVFGSEHGYPDERPATRQPLRIDAFWIDQTEVTVAQFTAFVQATGYVTEAERQGGAALFHPPTEAELAARPSAWWTFVQGADWRHPDGPGSDSTRRGHLPITLVTRNDALAYARWLGRDLPTEAEWEYAGQAGQSDAQLDTAPSNSVGQPSANYWQGAFPLLDLGEDGYRGLAPVGCYAANPFGLHDMIGNVWEWTRDAYSGPRQPHLNGDIAAAAAPFRRPAGSDRPDQPTVIKGGSYLCSPDFCVRYRASAREAQEADLATAHIGFRTVLREPS